VDFIGLGKVLLAGGPYFADSILKRTGSAELLDGELVDKLSFFEH
jgi:hypothetical protein